MKVEQSDLVAELEDTFTTRPSPPVDGEPQRLLLDHGQLELAGDFRFDGTHTDLIDHLDCH
jgi:hypothetical protein